MDKENYYCKGLNGQINVIGNRIEITRKGFRSFICHGFDGTKIIFLKRLTGLQFKEAGKVTNGFIQFIFSGSGENKNGLFDATKDENTVVFTIKEEAEFENLKNLIIEKME